ncbi:unnamed protein product [Lathyrus sativus]|nr:unnamed protein product [Lathyrus sativus]
MQMKFHKLKLFFFSLFILLLLPFVKPDLTSERAALLSLRAAVGGRTFLWNTTSATPCNWSGVKCDQNHTHVIELHLPAVSLSGKLPAGVFSDLTNLHTLSLRFNSLSGPLPSDLSACTSLRNLYLQQNLLSGEIPATLLQLTGLVRLNLASNNFSGNIPVGFQNLTRLKTLYLQNNRFTGSLTELNRVELAQFNVSNNKLNGSVPEKLQTFGKDSFLGNNLLCGKPLNPCPNEGSASSGNGGGNRNSSVVDDNQGLVKNKKKSKLSGGAIAGIVIGSVVVLLLVVFALILICRNRNGEKTSSIDEVAATLKHNQHDEGIHNENVENGNGYMSAATLAVPPAAASEGVVVGGGEKKLVFFRNWGKVFGLEDLLRASAEVLGKGTFGTSYKAVLEVGPVVVAVKRLRDVTISEKEFKEKIERVGTMVHENLAPLRAYYYSRDEKLLVHDYLHMGSLSALLHGNKGGGRTPLTWDMRSGIALGAARGIEYLHSQGPNVSHGNIKSSNILLTKSYDARVSDFGLAHLVGPSSTPNRVAGYRAPEVTDPRKVSQKADVYSFGVLLLELLTGKAPTHALMNDEGVDLPRWVQSVAKEEWTSEVFDLELLRYQNVEEEMVQLLQLAVDCAATYPDNRPSMSQVRQHLEELHKSSLKEVTQDQIQHPDLINDIDDISAR